MVNENVEITTLIKERNYLIQRYEKHLIPDKEYDSKLLELNNKIRVLTQERINKNR